MVPTLELERILGFPIGQSFLAGVLYLGLMFRKSRGLPIYYFHLTLGFKWIFKIVIMLSNDKSYC